MLKAYDLVCPRCHFEAHDLLEYDTNTQQVLEEVLCEECGTLMKIDHRQRPAYGKHISWSQWAIGHGNQ